MISEEEIEGKDMLKCRDEIVNHQFTPRGRAKAPWDKDLSMKRMRILTTRSSLVR